MFWSNGLKFGLTQAKPYDVAHDARAKTPQFLKDQHKYSSSSIAPLAAVGPANKKIVVRGAPVGSRFFEARSIFVFKVFVAHTFASTATSMYMRDADNNFHPDMEDRVGHQQEFHTGVLFSCWSPSGPISWV